MALGEADFVRILTEPKKRTHQTVRGAA